MSAMRNVPGPDLNHPDSQKLELSCGTGGVDWCYAPKSPRITLNIGKCMSQS
jgi:hypothetical protein